MERHLLGTDQTIRREARTMTELTVRKHNEETAATAMGPARRASRLVRRLLSWDPFRQMQPIPPSVPVEFSPAFDVRETKDAFVFEADIPGIKEQDLEVTTSGDRLTVAGERAARETRPDTYYACERSFGEFSRSFTLPDSADLSTVKASLESGVLTVTVKKSGEVQSKKIAVQSKQS